MFRCSFFKGKLINFGLILLNHLFDDIQVWHGHRNVDLEVTGHLHDCSATLILIKQGKVAEEDRA